MVYSNNLLKLKWQGKWYQHKTILFPHFKLETCEQEEFFFHKMVIWQVQIVRVNDNNASGKYILVLHTVQLCLIWENQSYLMDLGRTLDIESLSISLTTNSFLKKNSVPLDTLTGIRTRSATIVIGTKIFRLSDQTEKTNYNNEQWQLKPQVTLSYRVTTKFTM